MRLPRDVQAAGRMLPEPLSAIVCLSLNLTLCWTSQLSGATPSCNSGNECLLNKDNAVAPCGQKVYVRSAYAVAKTFRDWKKAKKATRSDSTGRRSTDDGMPLRSAAVEPLCIQYSLLSLRVHNRGLSPGVCFRWPKNMHLLTDVRNHCRTLPFLRCFSSPSSFLPSSDGYRRPPSTHLHR